MYLFQIKYFVIKKDQNTHNKGFQCQRNHLEVVKLNFKTFVHFGIWCWTSRKEWKEYIIIKPIWCASLDQYNSRVLRLVILEKTHNCVAPTTTIFIHNARVTSWIQKQYSMESFVWYREFFEFIRISRDKGYSVK